MATQTGDPWLISRAQLALASALVEDNEAQGALTNALAAQESFARAGQHDSEWRAWLVAARASRRAGDEAKAREYAANAADSLTRLQQKWGGDIYSNYIARPDVQFLRKQLIGEFAMSSGI